MKKDMLDKIDLSLDKKCPKCGTNLMRCWGYGWDWDLALCPNKDCIYEEEMDESTGIDIDGEIFTIKREDD